MKKQQIFFTAPKTAELWEHDVPSIESDEVLVKMEYTVVSGGTEKACLLASENTSNVAGVLRCGICGGSRR